MLSDALSLPETPVPVKVARLLLVSDILHNSTAPVRNASRYRSLLEAALPDISESLQVRRLPARPPHGLLQLSSPSMSYLVDSSPEAARKPCLQAMHAPR